MNRKLRVLFVSGENSCRSQMAEGWMRVLAGKRVTVRSAGVKAGVVHPLAVEVMSEKGVDIGSLRSKAVLDLEAVTFDVVVTLCGSAEDYCTSFTDPTSGTTSDRVAVLGGTPHRLHWAIDDPAKSPGNLVAFRVARDEIQRHIKAMLDHGYLSALTEERERRD
ncbi:MAG: arsenate reductase ArsC, partial [Proteobacteria bacterium]|nr:arsenate reductase ArsC [Pseudomonadota bacterium]